MEIPCDTHSSLPALPPELASDLSCFLDGQSIASLYACGNQELNRLLTRGVTHFVVHFEPRLRYSFPRIVQRFPRLESFKLECVDSVIIEDVDLSTLPSTLLSLSLRFYNSYASLYSVCGCSAQILALKRMFPTLTQLDVGFFGPTVTSMEHCKFFATLPPFLNFLRLSKPIWYNTIRLLPPYLETLDISLDTMLQDWQTDPRFPPNLTSLSLHGLLSLDIVPWIPSSVTDLNLIATASSLRLDPATLDEAEVWSHFPPCLRLLHLPVRSLTLDMVKKLPPTTEELYFDIIMPIRIDVDMIKALPRSLKAFQVLSSFDVTLPNITSQPEVLDLLPRSLADTFLVNWSELVSLAAINVMPKLPPGLRTLRITRVMPGCLRLLPSSLTHLILDSYDGRLSDYGNDTLPSSLLKLELGYEKSGPFLDILARSRVPYLRDLQVRLSTEAQIAQVPTTLTSLYISIASGISQATTISRFKDLQTLCLTDPTPGPYEVLASSLPSSLQSLRVRFPIEGTFLRHLSELRLLQSLDVLLCGMLVDEDIWDLPRSLVRLCISQTCQEVHSQLSVQGWRRLPTSLKTLELPPPDASPRSAFEDCHLYYLLWMKFSSPATMHLQERRNDEFFKAYDRISHRGVIPMQSFM